MMSGHSINNEPRHRPLKSATYPASANSTPTSGSTTCVKNFSTMPRRLRHRSPKRNRCLYIEAEVESEGSGLDSLDPAEEVSVLHWKVDDLASQLTLINHAIFRELLPLDLASLKWYDPRLRNHPESQRVNAITTRFNYDGQWTISEILKQETPRQRADVMSHFIRVAERLFQLNNFHSSFALLSALLSSPIARLHQTMALLPKRDQDICQQLSAKYCPDNNWKSFREYQESAGYPRLPHIGFYKTDLIHAHHACTNVSEQHRRMKAIESRVFELFSRSNYGFLEDIAVLQKYLKSRRYLEELQKFVDDGNTKLSKLLEPDRGRGASQTDCIDAPTSSRPMFSALLGTPTDLQSPKTNLIDDSSIDDLMVDDAFLLSSGHSLSRHNVGNLSLPSNMGVLQRHYDWQGILERKNVVKNNQFQFIPRWKVVWAAVWGTNLFVFKPKSPFRTSDRGHFDGIPCMVYTLAKWKLESGSDEKLEFKLSAPDHSFIIRLKAHTVTEFREWIKFLFTVRSRTWESPRRRGTIRLRHPGREVFHCLCGNDFTAPKEHVLEVTDSSSLIAVEFLKKMGKLEQRSEKIFAELSEQCQLANPVRLQVRCQAELSRLMLEMEANAKTSNEKAALIKWLDENLFCEHLKLKFYLDLSSSFRTLLALCILHKAGLCRLRSATAGYRGCQKDDTDTFHGFRVKRCRIFG
ncbi:putative Ras-specific guanine nucleotide-releasing factor RalGPS1 [Hypsibius exemplaris]|uniref:Ras-specific guanine nucleotide-releasing factor RalGPS1 n=1 Tax=Hypsibius exemplaris TaxID=2072580 RepID=A0A1W0WMS1_HYPEX|nr:putative Ras-specific guanine nucleotide-releasing factor RalGPS1 [Hypsibius exemplaris]